MNLNDLELYRIRGLQCEEVKQSRNHANDLAKGGERVEEQNTEDRN